LVLLGASNLVRGLRDAGEREDQVERVARLRRQFVDLFFCHRAAEHRSRGVDERRVSRGVDC